MNRKNLGLTLIVVGALMLFFSNYIAEQVTSGKTQIEDAQKKVKTVDSVFSMSKYTDPVGKQITKSAQRKIDAGQSEVDKYEAISNMLKIGGVVLIVIGGGMFFFPKRRES